MERGTAFVALGLVAGLVAGCTNAAPAPSASPSPSAVSPDSAPSPDETTGLTVGVVLGAPGTVPGAELTAQRAAAEALAELDGVATVRVAAADTDGFVESLALLFADDALDIVCVVGTGTGQQLAAVARERPGQRFCGTDPTLLQPPANVAVVGADHGAIATVAGAVVGPVTGDVLLSTSRSTGGEEAFVAALDTGLPPPPEPEPQPSPSAGETPAEAPAAGTREVVSLVPSVVPEVAIGELTEALDAAPVRLVALAGPADASAAVVATAAGVGVVGITDWLAPPSGGLLPLGVQVALRIDRQRVLAAALRAAVGPGLGVRGLLGPGDGVVVPERGRADGSAAALARAERALAASAEEAAG